MGLVGFEFPLNPKLESAKISDQGLGRFRIFSFVAGVWVCAASGACIVAQLSPSRHKATKARVYLGLALIKEGMLTLSWECGNGSLTLNPNPESLYSPGGGFSK